MKEITLIPAPNGFGHIERLITFGNALLSLGFDVSIWLPSYSLPYICDIDLSKLNVNIVKWDANTLTSAEDLRKYILKIGDIDSDQFIISDNIIEVLGYHKKSILFANFFHHENSNVRCDFAYKNHLYKIIQDNCGRVYKNKFIHFFRGQQSSKFQEIKFLDFNNEAGDARNGSILISVGTTNLVTEQELREIARKVATTTNSAANIYLDPRIWKHMPSDKKQNILLANFTYDMYSKVETAFIRPGLSTIQKLLMHNAEINALLVGVNEEMIAAGKCLEENQLGRSIWLHKIHNFKNNVRRSPRDCSEYFYSPTELLQFIENQFNDVFL